MQQAPASIGVQSLPVASPSDIQLALQHEIQQLGHHDQALSGAETQLRQATAHALQQDVLVRAYMAQAPQDAMLQASWEVTGVSGPPSSLLEIVDTHVMGLAPTLSSHTTPVQQLGSDSALAQHMLSVEVHHAPTAWRGTLQEAVHRGECRNTRTA